MFHSGVVFMVLVIVGVNVVNACSPCSCQYYSYHQKAECSFRSIDKILPKIPDFLPVNTTLLQMNNQPLKSLEAHVFTKVKLSLLQVVELEYCVIKTVDKDAFNGVYNLSKLTLSQNEIQSLNPSVFATNKNLTEIDLSYNKITTLPNGLFSNLTLLKSVNLLKNMIQYVEEYSFYNNPELFKIDLQYNQLQIIEAAMVDRLKALTHLLINNNDWNCHCGLGKLRDLMAERHMYYRSKPSCDRPLSVRYKSWEVLTSSDFSCWLSVREPYKDENMTVYDEDVQLTCNFNVNPALSAINWSYGNETLLDPTKYSIYNRYVETTATNVSSLRIKGLTPADSGAYTCTGRNYISSINRTYYLTVITGYPANNTIVGDPIVELDEDTNNFTLACKIFAIPKPIMNWWKPGKSITSGTDYVISESVAETDHYWNNLTITRVSEYSSANYTCHGSTRRGSDSKSVEVKVRFLGYVYARNQLNNNWAAVSCEVNAYPMPKVKWQLNNVDISTQSSDKYVATTTESSSSSNTFNSVLRINDLSTSDIGKYRCIVENSHATKIGYTYIEYTHKPIIVLPADNTVHIATTNELTTIQCMAIGSPSEMNWIRNGKDLEKNSGKYLLNKNSGYEYWYNLTIFNIDESDAGNYQCVANNHLGFEVKTTILKVTGIASGTSIAIWIIIVVVIIIIGLAAYFLRRNFMKPHYCTRTQQQEIEPPEELQLNINETDRKLC